MEFLDKSFGDFCAPLKDFGVSFVRFVRVYQNHQQLTLCNTDDSSVLSLDDLGLYFYERSHSQDDAFGAFQLHGYKRDANHLTLIYKHHYLNYIDYICFVVHASADYLFHDPKSGMFKRFYFFFLDNGSHLLSSADKGVCHHDAAATKSDLPVAPDMQLFSSNMPIKRVFISETCYLTRRECECLAWLGNGKTYEEVSLIIGTALRTVINHVERIKEKLNLRTINEIIRFSIKNGFPDLFVA